MSYIPTDLYYTPITHTWVREEEDGTLSVGFSDYAQSRLEEISLIELPEVGDEVHASDEVGTIETQKVTHNIYSPVSGTIVSIHEDLLDAPALVNTDPYGDGWLFRIEPSDREEFENLLSPQAYQELLDEEMDN